VEKICLVGVFCALAVIGSAAETLVQGFDGNLYGTTSSALNSVFKITPAGQLTTLYTFCSQPYCADGFGPNAGLVQATDGNLYGTTYGGGGYNNGCFPYDHGCGTVFKITPGGVLTTLHSFCSQPGCADGAQPEAGLVQAADGNFSGQLSTAGPTALARSSKSRPGVC
jgi:hypothetical protein